MLQAHANIGHQRFDSLHLSGVCPAWLTPLPTAASSSDRLAMVSVRVPEWAARQ